MRCEGAARTFGAGASATVALQPTDVRGARAGARIALVGPVRLGQVDAAPPDGRASTSRPSARVSWPAIGDRAALRPGPVAVVFQGPSLLPPLTVARERGAAADPRRRATTARRAAAPRGARPARSSRDLADKLPEEISGGQAQRVAVARALAGRPAADPRRRADRPARPRQRRPRSSTRSLDAARHAGAALVVATHDPAVAERLDAALGDAQRPSRRSTGSRRGRADLAAGPARAPPRHACSRPRPASAVGVALLASIGTFLSATDVEDDRARDRAACRSTGRWRRRPARARRRAGEGDAASPASQRALPVGFAHTTGLERQLRRLDPDHRARAGCSACPPATRARSPASFACSPAAATACCSPSRRRPTSTRGPATSSRSAGPAAARPRARRRRRRPARGRLAVPAGGRAAWARSRRRRPTTSSCCPQRAFDRAMRGVPVTHPGARRALTRLPGSPSAAFTEGLRQRAQPRDAAGRRAGSSATTSARRSTRRARTPCTRSCCSSSSASPARCSPGWSPHRSPPPAPTAAAATPRCCERAARRPRRLVRLALAETAAGRRHRGRGRPRRGALAIGAAAFGTASFGAGAGAAVAVGGRLGARRPRDRGGGDRPAGVAGRPRADRRRPARARSAARTARRGGRATASTSLALAGAALVYWQASRNGYQLVLAPEGVPQVSVNWYALLAPGARLDRCRPARSTGSRSCVLARGRGPARARAATGRRRAGADRRGHDGQAAAAARHGRVALVALTARVCRLHGRVQLHLQASRPRWTPG